MLKGVYAKRKEFAPKGSKFFPFRVYPFSKGDLCAGKQTGSHKSYRPCKKWRKLYQVYQVPLISSKILLLIFFVCGEWWGGGGKGSGWRMQEVQPNYSNIFLISQ